MNHLDVGWSEPSFRENFRLPFFILIVLFVMVVLGATFIGSDGILRMLGLKDDSVKGTLTAEVKPSDAAVKLDMVDLDLSAATEIKWMRGSEHTISATHPACLPEKLTIRIPAQPDQPPEVIGSSEYATIKFESDKILVKLELRPEFIKTKIQTKPAGAKIEIDGIPATKVSPINFELKTGEIVKITANKDGYETKTIEYQVPETDTSKSVMIELKKKTKPASTPARPKPGPVDTTEKTGKFELKSSYPVDVFAGSKRVINNRKSATVPLSAGKHTLRIVNPDYLLNLEQTVTIRTGKIQSLVLDPPGKMALTSNPPGAIVYVDGNEIGKTPDTLEAAPGLYKVEFKWTNCNETPSVWVKVVSGQTRRIPAVKGCL